MSANLSVERPVVAVGDADVDIFLRVPRLPRSDEKIRAEEAWERPGGMVANFAAALSVLGTPCAFMGVVGDDAFGKATLVDLVGRGVDVSSTAVRPGAATYFCVVLLDPSGEKALVIAPTAAMFPEPSDLDLGLIARARHVHTTAANPDTALRVASCARAHGVPVSLDVEADHVEAAADRVRELLGLVDVLLVNRRALDVLVPGGGPAAPRARTILVLGPAAVAVTLGREGAVVAQADGETVSVPGHPVRVADTTGAGDCFAAAMVHARLRGQTIAAAARFANVAAALSTTRVGGRSAVPTEAEVFQHLSAPTRATRHADG